MLKKIEIKNFKCFEQLSVELTNLNVLAGINSMGKSSVIQALLLLRQSFELGAIDKGIYLNGALINIGTGRDLLYRESKEELVSIMIDDNESERIWQYQYDKGSSFQKIDEETIKAKGYNEINLFKNTFSYISAERVGPQRFYENTSSHEVLENNQVGYRGELFPAYLAEATNSIENDSVIYEKHHKDRSLTFNTQMWLSEISPGIKIKNENYIDAGVVSLRYGDSNGEHSPLNVGFGLSYAAPVIVSLLKARKGDLVILENPEAHLHPKGQRKMGELISRACAGGVQVIVETHSDHLLNGIRLAVKNKVISRHDTRLNYFYQEQAATNGCIHQKCSPAILDDGSLSNWPDGFFDEWDKAIDELL